MKYTQTETTGQVCDSSLSVFSILTLYVSPAFFFP